ncbi:MAG TPA: LytTR family DNA-binding domain-containing protein [Rubricoccaceae bacterium]|jgi:DNA-binding LytR/AlgR family response regulator
MRVLIVEDEPVIARRLARLLREEAGGEVTSVETCATLGDAEASLARGGVDVDVVFLNLNGRDGFDLLAGSVAGPFHTVVVSAHTGRALEAFEVGVLDFVGKPFGVDRIRTTLDRLRGARAEHPAAALAVRAAGRIDLVPVADVVYVQAVGAYSELVLRDGSRRLHSKLLDRLLAMLPRSFERVHRSYLVRLDEVVRLRVREGNRYAAVLRSGAEVPVGRTRVDSVRARLVLL